MTPAQFRNLRLKLGLTQAELAGILGWSNEHVSRIENGVKPIMPDTEVAMLGDIERRAKRLLSQKKRRHS